MNPTRSLLLLLAALLLSACGKPTPVPAPETTTSALDQALSTPADTESPALTITAAKQQVKDGDTVTIQGKVMGSMTPFVERRAAMLLGDESTLTSCDLLGEDDHCTTPWDLCCADPDEVRSGTVLVQVLDSEGRVLREDLKGYQGLKELSRVRVTGTVSADAESGTLVLNARSIQVQ